MILFHLKATATPDPDSKGQLPSYSETLNTPASAPTPDPTPASIADAFKQARNKVKAERKAAELESQEKVVKLFEKFLYDNKDSTKGADSFYIWKWKIPAKFKHSHCLDALQKYVKSKLNAIEVNTGGVSEYVFAFVDLQDWKRFYTEEETSHIDALKIWQRA